MKIHNIQPREGSVKKAKRLGRGIGSGLGKTSGKGHKGQWARSGGGVRIGFEGGQMPLMRRIPKSGFTNIFRKEYTVINLDRLNSFDDGATVNAQSLLDAGLISKIEHYGLKVLGGGAITKKLTVVAAKFTASAKEAIEKAGGTAQVIEVNDWYNSAKSRQNERNKSKNKA